MARTLSMVSACSARLSGRYRFTRANRSARHAGCCGLALKATSTTTHVHGVPVPGGLQPLQQLRLLHEQGVCQALEGLAQRDKRALRQVPGAQVQVAEPTPAAAVAPLGGEDD